MINFAVCLLAAVTLSSSTTASPFNAPNFTFAKWVDEIIANPSGPHLSPEEAVTAYEATITGRSGKDNTSNSFLLLCNKLTFKIMQRKTAFTAKEPHVILELLPMYIDPATMPNCKSFLTCLC